MMERWQSSWNGYNLRLDAPAGMPAGTTSRLSLTVLAADGSPAASGWLKYRPDDHYDAVLNEWFVTIVLSNLEVADGHVRGGLGTAIVRAVARQFPTVLLAGENPNQIAVSWHRNRLEKLFPTRMLDIDSPEERVSPGIPLDPAELI